jgi:hypothetical protein
MSLSNIQDYLEKKTKLLRADDIKVELAVAMHRDQVQKTVLGIKTPYSLKMRKRKYKDLI